MSGSHQILGFISLEKWWTFIIWQHQLFARNILYFRKKRDVHILLRNTPVH